MSQTSRMPDAAKLSVAGLLLAAAGMVLQMIAGSTLYPSLAGPIVLLLTALLVVFGPARWTRYVALLIPLVLGLGALVAAAMTGDFIGQLTSIGNPGLVLGSWMHVAGLIAAVAGGVGMLAGARTPVGRGA